MAKKLKESVPEEAESAPAEETVEKAVAVIPEPEPEAVPAPIRIPSSTGPTFGQRLRAFLNFLIRLLLLLGVLAALSVVLYFALPLAYQKYILPVQENTNQLQQVREQQVQNEQTIVQLQEKIAAIETRQTRQAESLTDLDTRMNAVETGIVEHTESLAALDEMQVMLQARDESTTAELERQVDLLKAMELLSRARLFMYQSNFGLAKQDVQIARDLLAGVRPDAPETLAGDLDAILLRLDLVLTNLPGFPVAAADDLDIAWQILLGGASASETPPPIPNMTPSPTPIFTPTPTTTLIPTAIP